jgi:hypothetical protein
LAIYRPDYACEGIGRRRLDVPGDLRRWAGQLSGSADTNMTLDDFFDFNSARARVFLHREGDQKSMALLSDSGLLVIYKGKRHLFQIENLKECRAEDKKLLFPLIVGGIMAPFAFLSFLIHPMQPWIHFRLHSHGSDTFVPWMDRQAGNGDFAKEQRRSHFLSFINIYESSGIYGFYEYDDRSWKSAAF